MESANFAPPITGEEMCRALGQVANHVLAVMPKGPDTWEVHVTTEEIRESLEVEGLTLRVGTARCRGDSLGAPGGTWVRIRGLPLNMPNEYISYFEKVWGSDGRGQTLHVAIHVHKKWRPAP